MTPEQLDHLTKLKAHLESLLATAAKRTPGEWEVRDRSEVVVDGSSIAELATSDRCCHEDEGNAAFITACAGNAEAGWRSTLAAIKWAEYGDDDRLLENILAEWPTSLITS